MRELECDVELGPACKRRPRSSLPRYPAGGLPLIVRSLVLAHQIQQALDEGRAVSLGDVARRLGLTQPRVTQIMALRRLAPAIQERLLLDDDPRIRLLSEHRLRAVLREPDWPRQVARFEAVLAALASAGRSQVK